MEWRTESRSFIQSAWSSGTLAAVIFTFVGIEPALGFDGDIHRAITVERLRTFRVEVSGQTKTFSERALDQVSRANNAMDGRSNWALSDPEKHFTNERFADSSSRLMNLKSEIIANLKAATPNGDQARTLLGNALHAVQDFYSHANWVELGNSGINTALGRSVMSDPPLSLHTCPDNPHTLASGSGGGLTSAYFVGGPDFIPPFENRTGCNPALLPTGKCFHGNQDPRDLGTISCFGIHKDGPARPFHAQARSVAEVATTDYVQQIIDEIAGNEKAISALLDIKGTIGFVIDDTGSMGEEIGGVKLVVAAIVRALNALPSLRPDNWLLERFNDPDFVPPFVTDSADALLTAVNALRAHLGGDCPELSQSALLEAIAQAFPNGRLYVFTDASAKDASLANAVISQAQAKGIRINYLLTGTCSPVDDAYIRGAMETGGQLFFIGQFEVPVLFDLVEPQLSGDLVTILSVQGTLGGESRMFSIPVDSTVTRLLVSVAIDTKTSVTLRRPSGEVVTETDPDARIASILSGCIFTLQGPVSGVWKVEIAGRGSYSVVAEGNSPIEFYRFDFVEPNPDIHGGFFPIPGQPLAGANVTGEATILGPTATANFKLVDQEGETVQLINLVQNFPSAARDHFLGMFTLPSVPFRVVVTGNDMGGVSYQRHFPTVYRAQLVGVEVAAGPADTVPAGGTTTFRFTVRNLGSAASFHVASVASFGAVTRVEPQVLALAPGALGTVEVDLAVPEDAPTGTPVVLTTTATKTDNPGTFNSAVLNLTVVGRPTMIAVHIDIRPRSCPNPFNPKSHGSMPVVILGTATFDISNIDPSSVRLAGVALLEKASITDAAAPPAPGEDCTTAGPDSFPDLKFKFSNQQIANVLGAVKRGDRVTLTLTGSLRDGTPIEGSDVVVIR